MNLRHFRLEIDFFTTREALIGVAGFFFAVVALITSPFLVGKILSLVVLIAVLGISRAIPVWIEKYRADEVSRHRTTIAGYIVGEAKKGSHNIEAPWHLKGKHDLVFRQAMMPFLQRRECDGGSNRH